MRGINKVILVGNLGKDPEYKKLQDGTSVVKLTLATTESFRNKNGEVQSRTDWHTIIAWRGLADLAEKYMHKGSLLYIEGKLRNRQYEDKEGNKKFVVEVDAVELVMLDKKEKSIKEDLTNESDESPF
ncbi:MAG: single-stranded DNA-binding protein [Ginsengibacter sp.]